MHLLDIAQNSVSAGAGLIEIVIDEQSAQDTMTITCRDNGCGMTPEQLEAVTDPFYTTRTTRKVGLGVPLFKMAAELTGGSFEITSQKGEGTALKAVFGLNHIDRAPLGDMNSTMISLIVCNPELNFVYTHRREEKEYTLDTRELREVLGEVPLNNPEVSTWIRSFLEDGELELSA